MWIQQGDGRGGEGLRNPERQGRPVDRVPNMRSWRPQVLQTGSMWGLEADSAWMAFSLGRGILKC